MGLVFSWSCECLCCSDKPAGSTCGAGHSALKFFIRARGPLTIQFYFMNPNRALLCCQMGVYLRPKSHNGHGLR
jgi:hypothetical protein